MSSLRRRRRPYCKIWDADHIMTEGLNIHNRRSIRLEGYDYSNSGSYFVTLVSFHHLLIFGDIINGGVKLNSVGEVVENAWLEIPLHIPFVTLNAYVIMPNHLHGIININEDWKVGTVHRVPEAQRNDLSQQTTYPKGPKPRSLGAIIGSSKSATTKRIHHLGLIKNKSIWQRNYDEHIIRSEEDLLQKIAYIQANPINWEIDIEYHPD